MNANNTTTAPTFENAISVFTNIATAPGALELSATANAPGRSLVLFQETPKGANPKAYAIRGNCRACDRATILRALIKSLLMIERTLYVHNTEKNAADAKKVCQDTHYRALMQCDCIAVTDRFGNVIPGSVLKVNNGNNIRKELGFNVKQPLYNAVVVNGLPFDDTDVIKELTTYVNAAAGHLDYTNDRNKAVDGLFAKETATETTTAPETNKAKKTA